MTSKLLCDAERRAVEFHGDPATPCAACSVPFCRHPGRRTMRERRHWFVPPKPGAIPPDRLRAAAEAVVNARSLTDVSEAIHALRAALAAP